MRNSNLSELLYPIHEIMVKLSAGCTSSSTQLFLQLVNNSTRHAVSSISQYLIAEVVAIGISHKASRPTTNLEASIVGPRKGLHDGSEVSIFLR
jgi:hypothetical protein